MGFVVFGAAAVAIGFAAGRIATEYVESLLGRVVAAVLGAAAAAAATNNVLLALLFAASDEGPGSLTQKAAAAWDLSLAELAVIDQGLVEACLAAVLVIAPAAAIAGVAGGATGLLDLRGAALGDPPEEAWRRRNQSQGEQAEE